MCLQWCHVRNFLIDNDLPCELWCPEAIRLARQGECCQDCIHYHPFRTRSLRGQCALTSEMIPLTESCCHRNAVLHVQESVVLRLGKTVPVELLRAHGISNLRELFWAIESAPDLSADAHTDGIEVSMEALSIPLIYGVSALDWEQALYGEI
jgi:hypothetical protein